MTRQEAFTLLGVYILGMVWIILNNIYDISLVLCPTKILFGIPCPSCGMTRAVKLCLEGELLAAVQMNPNIILVWIILPIAPFILITQLATKKDYLSRINACLDKKVYLVIILIAEKQEELSVSYIRIPYFSNDDSSSCSVSIGIVCKSSRSMVGNVIWAVG